MSSQHHSRRVRLAAVAVVTTVVAACGGSDDGDGEPTDSVVASTATTEEIGSGAVTDDGGDGDEMTADEPTEAAETDEGATDGGDSGGDSSTDAPAIDTGTVVIAGETFELTGPSQSDVMIDPDLGDPSDDFDFGICETVNPAFAGSFNIVGTLADGTPFRLSGTVDEEFDEFDGLFIGDTFEEERATDTVVALDGRTLSGTASVSRGAVEFTFTC
ncbi:MAG: hypothetical protein AAGF73_10485 [Actinomycetota bacterium]